MAKKLSAKMIHIKKIKKIDCRVNKENKMYNKRYKTLLKNAIKSFKLSIENKSDKLQTEFSALDKTVKRVCHKGIIHRNKRDRILGRLYKTAFKTNENN